MGKIPDFVHNNPTMKRLAPIIILSQIGYYPRVIERLTYNLK
jgi:hypothetical protein